MPTTTPCRTDRTDDAARVAAIRAAVAAFYTASAARPRVDTRYSLTPAGRAAVTR